MRLTTIALSLCSFAIFTPALFADTFQFSFTGVGISGNGTLTTSPDGSIPDAQDVIGITGNIDGVPILSLVPGSYDPNNLTNADGIGFDNLLYPTGSPFDEGGITFELSNSTFVNLWGVTNPGPQFGQLNWLETNGSIGTGGDLITGFTLTPIDSTPEPSSLVLLGTGLVGAAGLIRRRLESWRRASLVAEECTCWCRLRKI